VFGIGDIPDRLVWIYEIVKRANMAGREIARPGIAAGMVDQTTRKVIQEAGFGEFFFHRTGHGLGLEAHEPPYIFGENQQS
jgi:Xaa-Pro dipeptidase